MAERQKLGVRLRSGRVGEWVLRVDDRREWGAQERLAVAPRPPLRVPQPDARLADRQMDQGQLRQLRDDLDTTVHEHWRRQHYARRPRQHS